MYYGWTRTGKTPMVVPERPAPNPVQVRYYHPKPSWMTHIPGPWLRFADRFGYASFLEREANPVRRLV